MPVFGSNETISFLSLSSDKPVMVCVLHRKVPIEPFPNVISLTEADVNGCASKPIHVQLLPVVKVEPAL